jgi:hypothetical protein
MQTYGKAVLSSAPVASLSSTVLAKSAYWRKKIAWKGCAALGLAALGLAVVLPLSVLAKPLTKADIEGKKMCWGDDFKIFYPGGKVYNNKVGEGTWSIDKAGVISVKFPYGVVGTVRDAGGGSFVYSGSWINANKITVAGALCN